jgi:cob(I)alamin adenosyltransferase
MKIYTKTGDNGETGLLGGVKVSKSHPAIETVGTVDELNSLLGLVATHTLPAGLTDAIAGIQNDLFDIGSRIAACLSDTATVADVSERRIVELESTIDRYDETLAPLKAFILPSGCAAACCLHLSRAVCRRAERRLVELLDSNADLKREFSLELIYLNRLSDLLFVLSRSVNQDKGVGERKWQATKLGE